MSRAVDVFACPTRWGKRRECHCAPACAVCGFTKHMGIHGAINGGPPGSTPWGHEFQPQTAPHQMCQIAKEATD